MKRIDEAGLPQVPVFPPDVLMAWPMGTRMQRAAREWALGAFMTAAAEEGRWVALTPDDVWRIARREVAPFLLDATVRELRPMLAEGLLLDAGDGHVAPTPELIGMVDDWDDAFLTRRTVRLSYAYGASQEVA